MTDQVSHPYKRTGKNCSSVYFNVNTILNSLEQNYELQILDKPTRSYNIITTADLGAKLLRRAGFRMALSTEGDYCPKHSYPFDLLNGYTVCFLCGRNEILLGLQAKYKTVPKSEVAAALLLRTPPRFVGRVA